MSDILNQLNEAQRAAAACIDGPVMIIAGAGSGKTRTLTYRIAHLIDEGVDSFRILALTFTNKAAAEMKDRIIKLVGAEARNIWMGTFHSVFARILRAEATRLGYTSSFTIYDDEDSKSAVKQILKQLNLDPKTYNPKYVLARISMAKSNLISVEEYLKSAELQQEDSSARKPMIGEIYKLYNQRLRNSMSMDFDDLLYNTNVLFRDFPDVLLKYQNRFLHVMVDEYQDTNYAQYLIVKKLAARHQNICVVGDDAQSIYAFRGANIQNIFNFKRDYPNVRLFKLEQNYRSTQNIVKAANSIISNNEKQIPKEIWTDNAVGNPIRLLPAADEREEGALIAQMIQHVHLEDNIDYSGFAILYRLNSLSRALEEALRKMSIPYRIYAGISFYGRKEIKDVMAYLRLVVNNHDNESMMRAINYPPRGIGQTTMDKIRLAAVDNDVSICMVMENLDSFSLGINSSTMQRISEFLTSIKVFSGMIYNTDAYTLAKKIIYASGIIKLLREDPDPENPNRLENIEELLNGIQEFCEKEDLITPGADMEAGEVSVGQEGVNNLESIFQEEGAETQSNASVKTLDVFLQQVLLLTSEDKSEEEGNKVSLMTIHAAKGLEFPFVFVAGMEENVFPSILSVSSRPELEEERRLFYVAVTRAEKQLVLSYATTRYQYGNASCQELSRFVDEIDEHYIDKPTIRSPFPKVGQMPRTSFFGGGRLNPKETTSTQFQKKQQEARRNLKKIEAVPNAPSAGNTIAQINAIMPGMMVHHIKFGMGKIISVEGAGDSRKAIIFFENLGQKQLLLKFAKLSIVES